MKSKWIPVLILCIIFFLTAGCTQKQEVPTAEPTAPKTAAAETTAPVLANLITEQELLDLFNGYAYADPANRVVIGCVVMTESDYGIIGVVQYTTEDYEGCLFDFLRVEGQPLQAGVAALPDENTLKYVDKDTVSCDLIGDDGVAYTCKISFYQNDVENGFKIETEQKEG